MTVKTYHHFCPVAKASEILEPRWTLLILGELWDGSTRFNEIRRGIPNISPTLLSRRLKEMEAHDLVRRQADRATGEVRYTPTKRGWELQPIAYALGQWAHRNIDAEVSLEHLDGKLLMWAVRRKIDTRWLPPGRQSVIQFSFPGRPADERRFWLIHNDGEPIDLCATDPAVDVDLYITADLYALTSAWMGYSSMSSEIAAGKIEIVGDPEMESRLDRWLIRSEFATA